jgi:hypothetical protein
MKKTILFLVMALALTTQTLFAQVPSYVPTNGLVGYWPFNGNANDESGNGNNGTVINGALLTSDRFNNLNSAYSFDGVNDRIFINNSIFDNGSSFTFSGWYFLNTNSNPNNGNNSHIIFNTSPHNGFAFDLNWGSSNKYSIFVGSGTPSTSWNILFDSQSNQNIEVQTWKFVTLVKSLNTFTLYINGVIDQTWVINNSVQSYLYKLYFGGCDPIISNEVLNGKLDDIGIWNRALTQQEITNLYNSSLPQTACLPANIPTTGLVGYWPFCGNANDESGNGNNGTNNGATLTTDRFGNSNSAYSFNGINNWIQVANSSILNPVAITISAWIKPNDYYNGNASFIVNKGFDQNQGHYDLNIATSNQKLRFVLGPNIYSESNSVMNLNEWKFITATITGLTMKIYINGVLENTVTQSTNFGLGSNIEDLYFGKMNSVNFPYWFNGIIDDIGIWNRALTQEEITNLYNVNQCITNITVTDTLIINVGQLSFNDPVTWANNITIAPNPASTEVNINFNNITNLNGGTLKVINSLGQEVATTPITTSGTNSTMQLATWGGTGMYFVQIINPQGQIVDIKKIILQ